MSPSSARDADVPPSRLDICVQLILKDGEFPAFSSQVRGLMDIIQEEQASAHRLAEFVLQDFSLTLKVLRVANSFHYNRSNTPIENISHAIVVLGVATVRALASTLLFFEHYRKRSAALKQLMILSMVTAHHARAAAAIRGSERKEEAYLSGMFRNFGEVLVACHFRAEHALIHAETRDGARLPGPACTRILGFTFEDLALAVGRYWQLPPPVVEQWRRPDGPPSELAAIVQFAHDLTTTMYRRQTEDEDTRTRLLVMRHRHRLGVSADTVRDIMGRALDEMTPIFALLDVTPDALSAPVLPTDAPSRPREAGLGPAGAGEGEGAFGEAIQAAEALPANFERSRLDGLLDPVKRHLLATGLFDQVVFAETAPDGREVRGRSGAGDGAGMIAARFAFPLALRGGPISTALMRQEVLLVDRDERHTAAELAAAQSLGAWRFVLVPVAAGSELVGCFYGAATRRTSPRITAEHVAQLKRVAEFVARAVPRQPSNSTPWTLDERRRVVARLVAGEDVGIVSRDVRVPARELERWKRELGPGSR